MQTSHRGGLAKARIANRCWMTNDIHFDEHLKCFDALKKINISGSIGGREKRSAAQVKRSICDVFPGVTVKDLESPVKHRKIAAARQVCMWVLKNELGYSFSRIGKVLGGRDNTTCWFGTRRVDDFLLKNGGNIFSLAAYGPDYVYAFVLNDVLSGKKRAHVIKRHGISRMSYALIRGAIAA